MKTIIFVFLIVATNLKAQNTFDYNKIFEESDLILTADLSALPIAVGWACLMEAHVLEVYKGNIQEQKLMLYIYPRTEFDIVDGSTRILFFKRLSGRQYGPPEGFKGENGYWQLLAADSFRGITDRGSDDLQRVRP